MRSDFFSKLQRCVKNSNMISFWLTSWVTLWWPLINTRPKYYLIIQLHFWKLETKTDWYRTPVLFIDMFNKKKVALEKMYQFSRTDFLLISWRKKTCYFNVLPILWYIFFLCINIPLNLTSVILKSFKYKNNADLLHLS